MRTRTVFSAHRPLDQRHPDLLSSHRHYTVRTFVVNCGTMTTNSEYGRIHTTIEKSGAKQLPKHTNGSRPDRDPLPADAFQTVEQMAVLRRLMEELFNQNCSLHDPLMISLSSQLDDLVVREMRKRSRDTRSSR